MRHRAALAFVTDSQGERLRLVWYVYGFVLLLVGCALAGLRLNLSGSMPVGLYLIVRDPPVRGSIILVCLPPNVAQLAVTRGYIPRGGSCPRGAIPVGKPLLAIPGDTVEVTAAGLVLNGALIHHSRALEVDRMGRTLPRPAFGRRTVGIDELWLVSSVSPNSFDSRYFGPIARRNLRSHVRPLWTAGLPSRSVEEPPTH